MKPEVSLSVCLGLPYCPAKGREGEGRGSKCMRSRSGMD
jgi:hypothetical protein